MCEAKSSYPLDFSFLLSINAQLTLHHKCPSLQYLKIYLEIRKEKYTFVPCRSYNYY
nr:MAG TPA: hypothetical protein [Microviridae sp.]